MKFPFSHPGIAAQRASLRGEAHPTLSHLGLLFSVRCVIIRSPASCSFFSCFTHRASWGPAASVTESRTAGGCSWLQHWWLGLSPFPEHVGSSFRLCFFSSISEGKCERQRLPFHLKELPLVTLWSRASVNGVLCAGQAEKPVCLPPALLLETKCGHWSYVSWCSSFGYQCELLEMVAD